jgi:hypothetical protein
MRMAPTLVAGIATLALVGAAPVPGAQARGKVHSCRPVDAGELLASRVRTEYPCSFARARLFSLLGNGLAGIPRPKARSGRWGCRADQSSWNCSKYPRRGSSRKRIRFKLTIEPGPGGGIPGCVRRWNKDAENRALFGFHLYYHHNVRRLWVFLLPSGGCVFVAVVPPDDAEYGNDGQVSVPGGGWAFLVDAPELGDTKALQGKAPANANASLAADGSVKLDQEGK